MVTTSPSPGETGIVAWTSPPPPPAWPAAPKSETAFPPLPPIASIVTLHTSAGTTNVPFAVNDCESAPAGAATTINAAGVPTSTTRPTNPPANRQPDARTATSPRERRTLAHHGSPSTHPRDQARRRTRAQPATRASRRALGGDQDQYG